MIPDYTGYQIVIPARAGSKRLPDKNIRLLGDVPLIVHTIRYAKRYFPTTSIWVNSDCPQVAALAAEEGVEFTERPAEYATDTTPTVTVLQHQLNHFNKNKIACDHFILLQATNPLRPTALLPEAVAAYKESGRSSLAGFSRLNRKFGLIEAAKYLPENYRVGERMQDLVPRYYENGLIYLVNAGAVAAGEIITEDCYPLVVDHPYTEIDIDEAEDLLKAAFYLKHYQE